MSSAQGDRQAAVRALTGTTLDYNGDWSALFDQAAIQQLGGWNGRLLAWINSQLSTFYTNINDAMAAYAASQGATNWSGMGNVGAVVPSGFAFIRTIPGTMMFNQPSTYIAGPAISGQGVSP
jgi:hypothetical protein